MEFKNKLILITGASSGIGEATARLFATKGASVVLLARRGERLQSICDEINLENKGKASFEVLDVSKKKQIKQVFEKIVTEKGIPDVLINNAGLGTFKPIFEMTEDEILNPIKVPFQSGLLCTYHLVKVMKKNGGQIVFITGPSSYFPLPYMIGYTASRFGLRGMALALREELKEEGIKVNLITLGKVATDYVLKNDANLNLYPRVSKFIPEVSAEKAAMYILYGMTHNKKEFVKPWQLKWMLCFYKPFPTFFTILFKCFGLYQPIQKIKKTI